MSWKSIEMQVALPRTQDVGKVQEQLQQRNQYLQQTVANQQLLDDELKRKRVNDFNGKDSVKNKKQEGNTAKTSAHIHNKQTEEQELDTNHPYLGRQIDFNG